MRRWRRLLGNESGVAMIMALMVLLTLTGLVLAFLSVSAFEPQISKNLSNLARARYLAESGIETGFNVLVNNADATQSFSGALAGATAAGTAPGPWVALVSNNAMAGLTTAFAGSYTVTVRNDYDNSDSAVTGVPSGTTAVPNETTTADTNKIVIMRSTGTFNGATKTIEVVVRRAQLPPFPGAVNLPGVQSDTFINKTAFEIDGRNYNCSANCDTAANWTTTAGATNKYGIATQEGNQSNLSPATSYEVNAENATGPQPPTACNATCTAKRASIKGRDETGSATSFTTGLNTMQAVPSSDASSLTPAKMTTYLDALKSYPATTVLQSTQACPIQLTGTGSPTSTPTISNGCSGASGLSGTLDLGSRTNPKVVYVKGDTDPSSLFTGLSLNSGIKGAGILVIEDGDVKNLGNFTWDGIVIVTGNYVGSGFMSGSDTTIRGAFVANEMKPGEVSGFFEFYLHGSLNSFSVKNSQQNIDMVQVMRGNTSMTNWREL